MALAKERCAVCRADSPLVTPEEEPALHAQVPDWEIVTVDGVRRLKRVFRLHGWQEPLDFTLAVGTLAAQEDHHPRLVTEWNRVTVSWWTHAIRGLHRNDFIMAAQTDALFAAREREA
ncbi:MAG: 4a-hydroxytetrahydrobiopterin dehydratase [Thermomicrobiales bacterium]